VKRTVATLVAALLVVTEIVPAARARAQAADPFPVIPLKSSPQGNHLLAYGSLIAGAGLIGASFALAKKADQTYDDYLAATDPSTIQHLYDQTVHYDRLSSGALLSGEVLIAAGLYLRFLRRSPDSRLGFDLGPQRCAATLRF
jgi:hypothetical protein